MSCFASFPNITIQRGVTLNPIFFVLYDDLEKTERTDLTSSLPVALVRSTVDGSEIVDLAPTIELYSDYVAGETGDVIVFSLTGEQTASLTVGTHRWDLVNEYDNEEKQLISSGKFTINETKTLS
jgi:hypothetical protein